MPHGKRFLKTICDRRVSSLVGRAAWTHVDAAWGSPLRLTRFADRLEGIARADSVAVSSHKWLFQPKESALVLFRDSEKATEAISFGCAYLTEPNVGLLGSHGVTAIPLLATLMIETIRKVLDEA